MKNKTIMIADDDEDLLFLLKNQLTSAGYTVNSCHNGNSIINKLIAEKPSVVLLDIHMAGIDGDELCRLIKKDKSLSDVKVVIMSGEFNIEKTSISCGADGFIRKPLSFAGILNKISGIFSDK